MMDKVPSQEHFVDTLNGAAPMSTLSIRDLLSYRVSRTAGAMSRSAALRYAGFGVSLQEWRTLALLAAGGPLGLTALARAAGLDKAQMSRAVTALVTRGLVRRSPPPGGTRATALSLSRAGQALYARLIGAAAERDRAFRACLAPGELAVLEAALDKLQAVAVALGRASQPVDGINMLRQDLADERPRDPVRVLRARRPAA